MKTADPASRTVLRIAVPTPLHRSFDYLPPAGIDVGTLRPGVRVRIPFGRRKLVGVLLAITNQAQIDDSRLKPALAVLDKAPVIADDILAMVQWASAYYHHPVGEALAVALPVMLRRGETSDAAEPVVWQLTGAGHAVDLATLGNARRQAAVLEALRDTPAGLPRADLDAPASVLQSLAGKGWIEQVHARPATAGAPAAAAGYQLNDAQQAAVDAIAADLDRFQPWLLDGVTGSGKTEVYLQVIEPVLAAGRQVLVLVPEIGLTPQLVERFRRRFPVPIAVLHSALTGRERLQAWQRARRGEASIVLGTRSAIFTPLERPGLLIVDEEHDASLKQQDGFRYSARDLAVWRARRLGVPVILGSATPALESLYNVQRARYRHLQLPERTGNARLPDYRLVDVRDQVMRDGLSPLLVTAMQEHLDADGQVLVFLNRRGYAPTLMCYDCDWVAACRRCDAHMTFHRRDGRLHCHHCGSQRPVETSCPECAGTGLHPVGQGTERIEQALAEQFPDTDLLRIDRDTTRRKGELDRLLARARAGHRQLLLGTQMLAKGHHFPNVTLVAILDADQGLFSTEFRASERMAQQIVQVAGRAGRHERPGEVIIQTAHPGHPLLQQLVTHGYPAFARAALAERAAAGLPPLTSIALLRADAGDPQQPVAFLEAVRAQVGAAGMPGIEAWGPVPATMARRAGRYRAQLLLNAGHRGELQQLLAQLVRGIETSRDARRVRWSIDVDPADTY